MSVVKSIVRWFFGLQATVLVLIPVAVIYGVLAQHSRVHRATIVSTHLPLNLTRMTGFFLLGSAPIVVLGAVFAMAWWTTRKPSATRNLWAIAASLLYLAEGIVYFVYIRRHGHSSTSGLDLIAVGVAGLVVFFRREKVPDPAITARNRTPIAGDRTSVWTRHAATSLAVVAQIVAMIVWGRWAYTHGLSRSRGFTWIALVALTSILTTIIHECGHAVMAWCFEMGLLSFKAGPFQWAKREGKWKFKFHAAGLLTAGGAVGAVPIHPDQPRWEEILMIAAGPLANVLFGVPAMWAVIHNNWAHYQQTWELVAFTGSFCLIAAVLNLFPFMSEEGGYSDGARILQIVTSSPLDDYHRTMASIASTTLTARRYRDLDVVAIDRAASLFPNEFRELHLHLCASHCYEDSGRLAEASASLATAEAIYDKFSVDVPGPLHTIFVIGHAYLNRDAAAARLWWDRMEAKKRERINVDYWLAKTALHWIEGNLMEAEKAWQKADSEARGLPQFGAYKFDRFRCGMLREALDQALQAVAPELTSTPIVSRTPATAKVPVAQTAPIPTRPPVAIIPALVARTLVAHQARNPIVPSAAQMVDPLLRIFPVSSSQTPAPIPFDVAAAERLPTIDAPAMLSARAAFPSTSPSIAPSVPMASVTIAPSAIAPVPEITLMPAVVTYGLASFTRIPASSVVVPETPFARISLLPIAGAGSETPAVTSTGAPPPLKAPAVPAAFARRPVRPVPAPPSNLYAEPAVDAPAAQPIFAANVTPDMALATAVVTAPIVPSALTLKPIVLPPPLAVAPDAVRFDPLEFIRGAVLENGTT